MQSSKFQIYEFKLDKMVAHPSIAIIAKRGSGKSYITRDIVYHFRHIPGAAVIAPTDVMNPFYKFFFPDIYIHYDIKDDLLKNILMRQMAMIEKHKENPDYDPTALLVMDDCMPRKKNWDRDETIIEVIMNARHYKLPYILTTQTPVGISPEFRMNFDYVFLLKEDSTINRRKLWQQYACIFPTFESFEKVFVECTRDYGAMVIDNRKPTDSIAEKVFWFKAEERKFAFGSKSYNQMHNYLYNPESTKLKEIRFFEEDSTEIAGPIPEEPIARSITTDYLFEYFVNKNKVYISALNMYGNDGWSDSADYSDSDEESDADPSLKCFQHDNQVKQFTIETIDDIINIEPNIPSVNNCEMVEFAYNDNSYKFSAKITNLDDYKLIRLFCKHIEKLKNK